MRAAKILLASLALIGLALGLWAFWLEPASLRVREVTLDLPGWPRPGLRIALLADLHVGSPWNGLDDLAEVVAQTNAQRPDAVLILGDIVIQGVKGGTFVHPDEMAPVLAGLDAPLGVYGVLGNHDHWFDAAATIAALERGGVRMLEDASAEAGGVWFAGISDLLEGAHDVDRALAGVPEGAPVLALTHNPDVFPQIPARVALTVAGHTHGGQVALPLLGRPIVPAREEYAYGHVVQGGRHLFVSSGVGTSILPVRFRVPPEIMVLRLE